MNYFDLMKAITYAHVEAQGYKVSASTLPASGRSRNSLAGEGEVHASVASPSFQVHDGGTIEWLISDVERICNETK